MSYEMWHERGKPSHYDTTTRMRGESVYRSERACPSHALTNKGRVTIPAEVRAYLGIQTHDKIAFVIDEEGTVRLRVPPYPNIAPLRGATGHLETPLSWWQVQQIAYEDRFAAKNAEL